MAIITVTVADAEPTPTRWAMPPDPSVQRSPIPQGTITYSGEDAIATLAGGNQTSYGLNLTMPTGFAYLPRVVLVRFASDDITESWDATGEVLYTLTSAGQAAGGTFGSVFHAMLSPGAFVRSAAKASRLWVPAAGSPKLMLQGADVYGIALTDMDSGAGGSTAGDISYWVQFYVFNIDQIDKWEVNTPIPVISHVAF